MFQGSKLTSTSGGSREGCAPSDLFFLDFMQLWAKFNKILTQHTLEGWRPPPPPRKSWIRHCVRYQKFLQGDKRSKCRRSGNPVAGALPLKGFGTTKACDAKWLHCINVKIKLFWFVCLSFPLSLGRISP